MSITRALMDFPRYREMHAILHSLWSKAVGRDDYNKRRWIELETKIVELCRDGLGEARAAKEQPA